jgi:hypothetical protein
VEYEGKEGRRGRGPATSASSPRSDLFRRPSLSAGSRAPAVHPVADASAGRCLSRMSRSDKHYCFVYADR